MEKENKRKALANKFSKNFIHLQDKENISIEDLADILKISENSIKSYRRTKNPSMPDVATLVDIADYFCVTIDFLCGYSDEKISDLSFEYFKRICDIMECFGFECFEDEKTLVFKTQNSDIIELYNNIKKYDSKLGSLTDKNKIFYKLFLGKNIKTEMYNKLKRETYLYGHNLELNEDKLHITFDEFVFCLNRAKEYTNEQGDYLFKDKEEHWYNTNGNPTQNICDEYYDYFQ